MTYKYWKIILTVPLIVYIIFCVIIYNIQESFLFNPSNTWRPPPVGMDIEEVYIDSDENIKLHAWLYKNSEAKYTAIFFHGNSGNITERSWQLNIFKDLGIQALKFDYRGFGSSDGKINSVDEIYQDSEAVLKFLSTNYNIPYENIFLWGRSLGGGIASKLASQYPLKGMIIESSYSRLEYLLSDFPILNLAPNFIYKYFDLNNTENLKTINSPILIIHSKDDDIIPYSHAEEILAHAPEHSKLITLSGSHHRNQHENYNLYFHSIKDFIHSLDKKTDL